MLTSRWHGRPPAQLRSTGAEEGTRGTVPVPTADAGQLQRRQLRLKIRQDSNLKLLGPGLKVLTEDRKAHEDSPAHSLSSTAEVPAGPDGHPPEQPRKRLFTAPAANSAELRRRFICKVAAMKRWSPVLAYRLLPKNIAVLDGPAAAFLLWHLTKIQPAGRAALQAHLPVPPHSDLHYVLSYLYDAAALPDLPDHPHTPPVSWRPAVQAASSSGKAHTASERQLFNSWVVTVCENITAKLPSFSRTSLAQITAALGRLHVRLPATFWHAWEGATLRHLNPQGLPRGRKGRQRGQRRLFTLEQLGAVLQGAARCHYVPSEQWQQAWCATLSDALTTSTPKDLRELTPVFEGWATAELVSSVQDKQWRLPHTVLYKALETALSVSGPDAAHRARHWVGPCIALAAVSCTARFGDDSVRVHWQQRWCEQWFSRDESDLRIASGDRSSAVVLLWALSHVSYDRRNEVCIDLARNALHKTDSSAVSHAVCMALHRLGYGLPGELHMSVLHAVQATLPGMHKEQVVDVLTFTTSAGVRVPRSWIASVALHQAIDREAHW